VNSRERVLCALKHATPDRLPVDLGATESSGLTAIAYNRVKEHLGINRGTTQVFDVYQQVAKVEDALLDTFEIDTVPLLIEPREWKPWTLPDGSPCEIPARWTPVEEGGGFVVRGPAGQVVARMPRGGFYFEPVDPPLAGVTSPAGLAPFAAVIASYDWPFFADEGLDSIAARAYRLFHETDRAVVANLQLHLLAAGQGLRGFEQFMMDLLIDKPMAHALLEMLCDDYCERVERLLTRVGGLVQVVLVNDDLGTQQSAMLSLDCYREMILPYQRTLFTHIKQRTGASLLLHSCGAVRRFIPDLIDAGIDALNPVQVSAAGMHTASLKREFGRDLTFWGGGCDTQHVLPHGSARQVRDEVRRRVADLSGDGGFVFTQVHNVQPDVPPQNVVAMYEALDR
jgi:uroporphyrinogen decarboxylase